MTRFPLTESQAAEPTTDRIDATTFPLAQRVRAGLSWNISSSLITELIRFVRSIILARLLVPEDFGLFAMALTVVGALNALSSLGLGRTVVSSKFDTDDELKAYLNTVWSVELIRSFVLALLVSASAFPMSQFYGQEQLKFIIPVLGLLTLIGGFQNIGLVILRKQISFARIFWYELITNVVGLVLTVALAVRLRNVWALIIGLLLTAVLGTVLSYVFHSYRPRLALEKRSVRRILNVGMLTLLFAIASYVINMADNIIVGRLLGSGALGNYSMAFNIASTPISVLVLSMSGVLFPAYAEITSQRPKDLEVAFTNVFSIALLVLLTIATSLFLLAAEVVELLFGGRWATAATVLWVLALVMPLRGFSLLVSTFFWGLDRTKEVAVGKTIEALIFVAVLYPLVRTFGLRGAGLAGIIAYGLGCASRIKALSQILPGIATKLFQISLSTVAAAGAGLLIAWFSLRLITSPLPRILVGGLCCVIIPLVILLSFKPELRRSFREWFS